MITSKPGTYEHPALADLDFDNHAARTLHGWQRAGEVWNNKVRFLFHAAMARTNIDTEERQLGTATEEYVEAFARAATSTVNELGIEEQSVFAIESLVQHDDLIRRQLLYKWFDLAHIPKPHADFAYDLAMAYGDPMGVQSNCGPDYVPLTTVMADHAYRANLDRQSDLVLSGARHSNSQRRLQQEQSTRTRRIGLRAFGRYKSA